MKNLRFFCENHDFNGSSVNDEFDRPISADEVLKAVKQLKTNKAYGMDCLLNEYFIETIDILLPFICDIVNAVLDSGVFPDSMRKGIVIPLHNIFDKTNVNNYRGITIFSCFFKLFTTVLNNRVVTFCNSNTCISDLKIIKYWCKCVQSENIILNRLYTLAVRDCLSGYTN